MERRPSKLALPVVYFRHLDLSPMMSLNDLEAVLRLLEADILTG